MFRTDDCYNPDVMNMAILPLDMADITLITMKGNIPHCTRHGAMNAVGRYVEDSTTHLIWRCVTTYQFKAEDLHLPIEQRQLNKNPCRAGCITTILEHTLGDPYPTTIP